MVIKYWDYFYFLHNGMFYLKAKVNNASLVGIGYTQTLRPGKEGSSSITLITTVRWYLLSPIFSLPYLFYCLL